MSVRKQATKIGFATFVSRIFGLVREQVFAAILGAGFFSDCFFIAFRIPNLLRDLFAEGALSQAFVPTFTRLKIQQGKDEAFRLANLVFSAITLFIGGLVILGIIFAPTVVSLMAPGFSALGGKMELTVLLTRIMFPFLWMVSVAALMMGMLNVFEEFTVPAFAPVMFNVVSIFVGIALWAYDVQDQRAVIGWSIGTLLGGMAQALIQLPKALKIEWRPKLIFSGWRENKGLREIAKLMSPAIVANAGTQVNILVNTILSSLLIQGSASWLNYAFRLMQFPIGIFGVAISTVTLAKASRDASQDQFEEVSRSISESLRLAFILTVPCSVGFWLLGKPLIALIYQRGAFQTSDTSATALALATYAVGLPAYAAVKIVAPCFFALKDSRSPMVASLTGIFSNIVFNVLAYKKWGFAGLAFGTSLGMYMNLSLLLYFMTRKHLALKYERLTSLFMPMMLALIAMSLVCFQSTQYFSDKWMVLPAVTAATMIYFFVLKVLGVEEATTLLSIIKKRLRR